MRHRALSALSVLALVLSAIPVATSASSGPAPAGDDGPAAALAKYFDLIDRGDIEAADALCHHEDPAEMLLGVAMTTLRYSQGMCARAVAQRFGEEGVRQSVGRPLAARDAAEAKVSITGPSARVTLSGGTSFPMVRVEGRWKLSMRNFAWEARQNPDELAVGFRQMAQAHLLTAREVADGKHRNAADVRAALEKRGFRRAEQPQSAAR